MVSEIWPVCRSITAIVQPAEMNIELPATSNASTSRCNDPKRATNLVAITQRRISPCSSPVNRAESSGANAILITLGVLILDLCSTTKGGSAALDRSKMDTLPSSAATARYLPPLLKSRLVAAGSALATLSTDNSAPLGPPSHLRLWPACRRVLQHLGRRARRPRQAR